MPLSVLSALARQDIDPWQEAAQLAQLPGMLATRRLGQLIEAIPSRSSPSIDPTMLATKLLKLLPGLETSRKPKGPANNSWVIAYLMVIALIMYAEYLSTSHPSPADGLVSAPEQATSDHTQTETPSNKR